MRRLCEWIEARPWALAFSFVAIGYLFSEVGYAFIGKGRPHSPMDSLSGGIGCALGILPIYLWRRHEEKRKST